MSDEQASAPVVADSSTVESPVVSDRDAAIAAADVAKGAVAPEAPKSAPAKVEPTEAEQTRVAVVMRAKREAARIREDADAYRRENAPKIAQYESELATLRAQAEHIALLDKDPIAAFQKLGRNPRDIFAKALEDPSKMDPLAIVRSELEGIKAQRAADLQAAEDNKKTAEAADYSRRVQQAERAFIGVVADGEKDKYPTLNAVYEDDPRALIRKADAVADQFFAKTGEKATYAEICEYLEELEVQKYSRVTSRARVAPASESAPPVAQANSKRPLTNKDSSRRESTATPFREMTPAQQKAHLESEVDKAVKAAAAANA